MRIDLTLNDAALRKKIADMQRTMPAEIDKALLQTAMFGNQLIQERTAAGRGIFGFFKRYTPEYAMFRRKKGRQASPVNLEFTGKMLSAMQAFKGRGYADIGFTRKEEAKKAYYNHLRRPFFGFNQNEKRKLVEFMKKRLFK